MRRRWSQLSAEDDDRWTLGTWCLFVGLFLFYGGCLWLATGWGPGWLRTTGTCFQAVFECSQLEYGHPARNSMPSIIALGIALVVLVTPIAITLIPTLATLLWIMRRARRLQAQRGTDGDGGGCRESAGQDG
jgi:hypothetical protein